MDFEREKRVSLNILLNRCLIFPGVGQGPAWRASNGGGRDILPREEGRRPAPAPAPGAEVDRPVHCSAAAAELAAEPPAEALLVQEGAPRSRAATEATLSRQR